MPEGWDIEDTAGGPVEVEIGMRWTQLWRLAVRPWVPAAALGMVRPGDHDGLLRTGLRVRGAGPALVQVWEDRAMLDAWARRDAAHNDPWKRFAREARGTAAWGIWHRVRSASA